MEVSATQLIAIIGAAVAPMATAIGVLWTWCKGRFTVMETKLDSCEEKHASAEAHAAECEKKYAVLQTRLDYLDCTKRGNCSVSAVIETSNPE